MISTIVALRSVVTLEPLEDRCLLAVLTVNTTADDTSANSELTLREAVAVLNHGSSIGVISDLGRALTNDEMDQIDLTEPCADLAERGVVSSVRH